MKNEHGLTHQQEIFAQGVASGLSQEDSYRAAYPKSKRWKDEAVRVAGAKMMAIGNISVRIRSLQAVSAEIAALDGAKILEEVRRLAHSDIAGIMTDDGKVKLPHELDPVTRAAVSSFKIDEYGRIEYKFWPKTQALDQAMKHLGLYKQDNEQKTDPISELARAIQGGSLGPMKSGG